MGSGVGEGKGLAENMCPLEMSKSLIQAAGGTIFSRDGQLSLVGFS
jgi:hypothetical protein